VFFKYLLNNNPYLKKKYSDICEISLADLDRLKVPDFEEFMEYLKYREDEDKELLNKDLSIKRKISCLKSFFK